MSLVNNKCKQGWPVDLFDETPKWDLEFAMKFVQGIEQYKVKWVEEPLIRSYCFVRANPDWYFDALNTPGAVRYVWFSGKAAPIPNRQIAMLKALMGSDLEVDAITADLKPGIFVKVTAGPLMGATGELVSIGGNKKVIVRIDHLDTAISVTISPLMIEKLPDSVAEIKRTEGKKYKRFW